MVGHTVALLRNEKARTHAHRITGIGTLYCTPLSAHSYNVTQVDVSCNRREVVNLPVLTVTSLRRRKCEVPTYVALHGSQEYTAKKYEKVLQTV